MATNQLSINGEPYRIVDQSRVGTGRRNYLETMRASQPSEGGLAFKTWKLSGPIGPSRQIAFGDPLGPDYTVNLDGRNEGVLLPIAKRNAVALTGSLSAALREPTATHTTTNWLDHLGGGGSAHDDLNSYGAPVDGTYWTTTTTTPESPLTVGIVSQDDPGVDTGHVIRARIVRPSENTSDAGVKLRLYDDDFIIATSDEITVKPLAAVALHDAWTTGLDDVPTHTISGGTDRLLIAVISGDDHEGANFDDLTALTYGGQAMTQYGQVETQYGSPGDRRVEIWYLLEAGIAAASGTTLAPHVVRGHSSRIASVAWCGVLAGDALECEPDHPDLR